MVKWRRDAEKENEDWGGKEKESPLETDLQRKKESWNVQNKTEQGRRDRQTADGKGRWNDKDGGENPAGVRQTRGAGEDRQKEKRKLRGAVKMRWGSRGRTDRLGASRESMRRTDRWQGQEGALGCLHSAVFTS